MSAPPTPLRLLLLHPAARAVSNILGDVIRDELAHLGGEQKALLFRARDSATLLANAMCHVATQAGEEQDLEQAERVVRALHAALSGPAELAARTALIDRVAFTASVVASSSAGVLEERSASELSHFRYEWPEFGEALTASDFATAVQKWMGPARSGKWPFIVKMMRKAGMNPPTALTLRAEWSRHLAERHKYVWSWDGTRWVSSPRR